MATRIAALPCNPLPPHSIHHHPLARPPTPLSPLISALSAPLRDPLFFGDGNGWQKSAAVVGVEGRSVSPSRRLSWKTEVRYYGQLFNFNHYFNDTVLYRRPARDIYENYNNTIGAYLYPLRKYDRPFSQWPVFTELSGYHTAMLTAQVNGLFPLSRKLGLQADLDLNYLFADLDPTWSFPAMQGVRYLYPFFTAGLQYQFLEELSLAASLTNKAMNLDLAYPTHYQLSRPCVQLSVNGRF